MRESAMLAAKRGVRKLGILATEGALRAGIYQCALTPLGMDFALPCAETQAEISELIYSRIKKSLPAENGVLEKAKSELRVLGCDAAVLGCTELSLVKTEDESFFIDSLAVLAAASVRACGYPLSEVGKAFT
ncbi:MAG: aspartate/glutamate racemase family protein [Clostridia bacterium]|nr:aspartate/glutamate racemase family protein [Clostridia bacterium]